MKFFDRVKETATTTGTGDFTLAGAIAGFRSFASVLSTNDTCYYCIALQGGSEWEVGIGTYSAANTLTRTTVLASSNSGSAVNFSSGTKDVFLTVAAQGFQKPVFLANKNSVDQTDIAGNWATTKLTFTNEEFDSHGFYDATNSKFIPQIAGYYVVSAQFYLNSMAANQGCILIIYKNGSALKSSSPMFGPDSAANFGPTVTVVTYLNGSSDYIEIYAANGDSTSRTCSGDITQTYFQGFLVG